MSKHLWAVIKQNRTSIWVDWIIQIRLRDCSIWTVKDNKGAWGWRKMLSLRHSLVSQIHFCVGNGDSISLWHDPWHPLGPLISRFPEDSSLLMGPFKIPKNCFILWLAIMGRLSTLDKPWLHHIAGFAFCVRMVSLKHTTTFYFHARFPPLPCHIRQQIPLPWPHRDWQHGVQWASSRWRGKHVVNAAYRSLLASLVYHIWQERNSRRFQQRSRPPRLLAVLLWRILDRGSLVSLYEFCFHIGLYRLWKIPCAVEGCSI
ncbi:UNVERIFIED_CONTAM: hypothetical protein Sangu_3154400 [Sesamum angustifolium]|uniref:Reverse transcriptase zinc-binding domain-containing protein n=1 Tax=Sesamum angustifolium TaxID=2727405 RepID=A0AAW2JUB2_9LAMI